MTFEIVTKALEQFAMASVLIRFHLSILMATSTNHDPVFLLCAAFPNFRFQLSSSPSRLLPRASCLLLLPVAYCLLPDHIVLNGVKRLNDLNVRCVQNRIIRS
jgi:hypothetical protein